MDEYMIYLDLTNQMPFSKYLTPVNGYPLSMRKLPVLANISHHVFEGGNQKVSCFEGSLFKDQDQLHNSMLKCQYFMTPETNLTFCWNIYFLSYFLIEVVP